MRTHLTVLMVLATLVPGGRVAAQSLADRVAAVRDGKVRLSFAARAGVCGNGRSISTGRHTADWESDCEPGPVRVQLSVTAGRITDIDTYVGGRWRGEASDLGAVPAAEAARYLLSLARDLDGAASKRAVFPATLADSTTVWPELLAIAKNGGRPRATRKAAVFWLAQAAEEAATEGLAELAADGTGDVEVREHAVFALSQLPDDQGVPALIQLVRTSPDPRIRRRAIFWLGQSDDARALALFEELLTRS